MRESKGMRLRGTGKSIEGQTSLCYIHFLLFISIGLEFVSHGLQIRDGWSGKKNHFLAPKSKRLSFMQGRKGVSSVRKMLSRSKPTEQALE
jgi:hypothetical protein